MSVDCFTGRAEAYTKARPNYPNATIKYIRSIISSNAIVADIGAGTGKFTELIAKCGYEIHAVEPNADMRKQLTITLTPFPNVKITDGTAEATTLMAKSIDVITVAQALNRVDIGAFRNECMRIGNSAPIVISLYNYERGKTHSISRYNKSTSAFYRNPIVREFDNPKDYSWDMFLLYHLSMEGVPQEFDSAYEGYVTELRETFNRDSVDGFLRIDFVTSVYIERIV